METEGAARTSNYFARVNFCFVVEITNACRDLIHNVFYTRGTYDQLEQMLLLLQNRPTMNSDLYMLLLLYSRFYRTPTGENTPFSLCLI